MGTLTLRIPKAWVGHVNATQVRAWIATYSVNPAKLLPVRLPLEARVSWRLPLQAVRDLARKLICSPGEAVRRVVAVALQSGAQLAIPRTAYQPSVDEKRKTDSQVIRPSPTNGSQAPRIVSEEIF